MSFFDGKHVSIKKRYFRAQVSLSSAAMLLNRSIAPDSWVFLINLENVRPYKEVLDF